MSIPTYDKKIPIKIVDCKANRNLIAASKIAATILDILFDTCNSKININYFTHNTYAEFAIIDSTVNNVNRKCEFLLK